MLPVAALGLGCSDRERRKLKQALRAIAVSEGRTPPSDSEEEGETHEEDAKPETDDAGEAKKKALNKRNRMGETRLLRATLAGKKEKVAELIGDGADVTIADNAGWTPLHECTDHEMAVLLLRARADANAAGPADASDETGNTPLHEAVRHDNLAVVKVMMQWNADPAVPNGAGKSCLDLARGADEMVALLNTKPKKRGRPPKKSAQGRVGEPAAKEPDAAAPEPAAGTEGGEGSASGKQAAAKTTLFRGNPVTLVSADDASHTQVFASIIKTIKFLGIAKKTFYAAVSEQTVCKGWFIQMADKRPSTAGPGPEADDVSPGASSKSPPASPVGSGGGKNKRRRLDPDRPGVPIAPSSSCSAGGGGGGGGGGGEPRVPGLPVVTMHPVDVSVFSGPKSSAVFYCGVDSKTDCTYRWEQAGRKLADGQLSDGRDQIKGMNKKTLVITNLRSDASKTRTVRVLGCEPVVCVVTNAAGTARAAPAAFQVKPSPRELAGKLKNDYKSAEAMAQRLKLPPPPKFELPYLSSKPNANDLKPVAKCRARLNEWSAQHIKGFKQPPKVGHPRAQAPGPRPNEKPGTPAPAPAPAQPSLAEPPCAKPATGEHASPDAAQPTAATLSTAEPTPALPPAAAGPGNRAAEYSSARGSSARTPLPAMTVHKTYGARVTAVSDPRQRSETADEGAVRRAPTTLRACLRLWTRSLVLCAPRLPAVAGLRGVILFDSHATAM